MEWLDLIVFLITCSAIGWCLFSFIRWLILWIDGDIFHYIDKLSTDDQYFYLRHMLLDKLSPRQRKELRQAIDEQQ